MQIPHDKKLVCLTGTNWSGHRDAPRRLLVKDGFQRPTWFTTGRRFNDARYEIISETEFHLHNAGNRVLAHIHYSGSYLGILKEEIELALDNSERGVLIVCPQEIAEQTAEAVPSTIVFTLKSREMQLSPHLERAQQRGQLHRVDVDDSIPAPWSDV